jgi:hypothetical protein
VTAFSVAPEIRICRHYESARARAKAVLGWRYATIPYWHIKLGSRICGARGRDSHSHQA